LLLLLEEFFCSELSVPKFPNWNAKQKISPQMTFPHNFTVILKQDRQLTKFILVLIENFLRTYCADDK